jgi:endoglucanase
MRAWSSLFTSILATCLAGQAAAKVAYGGVNIAGFDFGVDTSGSFNGGASVAVANTGGGQMKSFVANGMSAFRLPAAWQYLASSPGTLNEGNHAVYDGLVQGCLDSGAALCIVDLHNYARWNGQIIGQGGPSTQDYASFWGQLAAKYANNPRIAFDTMNEPHDLDMGQWATTLQAVVTAIRKAGATSNKIYLSGTGFASLGAFPSQSGPALLGIKNPDGTTDNLIFSVHQYLDSNFSGTSDQCSQDVTGSVETLANWLRQNGRKAVVLETGGGNTPSCVTYVCKLLTTINQNADVIEGVTVWAAGAFDNSYALIQSTNDLLFTSCVKPMLSGGSYTAPSPSSNTTNPSPSIVSPGPSSNATIPSNSTLSSSTYLPSNTALGKANVQGSPTTLTTIVKTHTHTPCKL